MNHWNPLALLAAASLLLGGCGAVQGTVSTAKTPGDSSSGASSGETVSGIITKVNGNEITLDLVTLGAGAGENPGEGGAPGEVGDVPDPGSEVRDHAEYTEAPPSQGDSPKSAGGEGTAAQAPSFSGGESPAPESSAAPEGGGSGSGGGSIPGELPGDAQNPGPGESFGGGAFGGMAGGTQKNYTRTGESALYQIPVGVPVLTLTGTSRDFNYLSTDLLVTITLREDGKTPAQVQVIQSLS